MAVSKFETIGLRKFGFYMKKLAFISDLRMKGNEANKNAIEQTCTVDCSQFVTESRSTLWRKLVQRCLPLERQRRYWAAPCFVENLNVCVLFDRIFGARRGKKGVSLTAVSDQRRCLWTLPPLKRRAKRLTALRAGVFRSLR